MGDLCDRRGKVKRVSVQGVTESGNVYVEGDGPYGKGLEKCPTLGRAKSRKTNLQWKGSGFARRG